ncbi:MAG TPA: DNA repair exonuclease [Candidatus Thermoplasmatota archaeon]|jgi:DNA repair exonuclease SbcCD nuclease subunit|nr:DNA repair exonuclease [Candidatus Thermoplasmatota archaeon]
MRVLHVSDTHLGHAAYHKVSDRGLNQREEDVMAALARVVDKALELRPDVVLHSGDLFDVVRPSNRCLAQALEQLLRLAQAQIPVVAIAGNHEAPRLRETGSVFRFLEFFDGLRPVYQGKAEVVRVGGLAIHAVPQAASQEDVRRQLEEAHPAADADYNILAAHVGVTGIQAFAMGEFNEHVVPTSALDPAFDYVALGHYHGCAQVAPNAWYAGSTERMSFAEAGQPKGFLLADLAARNVEFHPIATRPMLDLAPIDADGMDAPALQRAIVKALDACDAAGKIVRLRVLRVPRHVHAGLDPARVQRAGRDALHCEVRFDLVRAGAPEERDGAIGPLAEEFDRFIATVPMDGGLDRGQVRSRAVQYLQEALG